MLDMTTFMNQWGLPTLGLVLTGLVGWLVYQTNAWLNAHAKFLSAQTKTKIAALETQALQEGADYLVSWAAQQAKDTKIPVDGAVTRFATQIALNHASGILASHGASPEEVAAKILSRLPSASLAPPDATGAVILATPKVETRPLAPVGG